MHLLLEDGEDWWVTKNLEYMSTESWSQNLTGLHRLLQDFLTPQPTPNHPSPRQDFVPLATMDIKQHAGNELLYKSALDKGPISLVCVGVCCFRFRQLKRKTGHMPTPVTRRFAPRTFHTVSCMLARISSSSAYIWANT